MENMDVEVYAVKHRDEKIRSLSRSGGIFTALTDEILNSDGVVYGCVLDEHYNVCHTRAETKDERNRMRGSKYVQSDMGSIFSDVKQDVLTGRKVLFSGTSCQVAGLNSYLGKKYENLICVDIVCHGVPSPLVWKEYLKWQEKRNGKCTKVTFRNKQDYGWAAHVETLWFERKNEKRKQINSKVFTTLFYGHAILRPSCYKCPYKSIHHPGDITIADYWGIDKAANGFNDNKGVSLVIINTETGRNLFSKVNSATYYIRTKIEDSIQPPLVAPFTEPKNRKKFWKDFRQLSFSSIAKKYGGYGFKSLVRKMLSKCKSILKRVVVKCRNGRN